MKTANSPAQSGTSRDGFVIVIPLCIEISPELWIESLKHCNNEPSSRRIVLNYFRPSHPTRKKFGGDRSWGPLALWALSVYVNFRHTISLLEYTVNDIQATAKRSLG
jgi:hypothetical protein